MLPDLNFRHLVYFVAIVREGSVTAAAKSLHVTQPTISGQIKRLEETLGEPLFYRDGRSLALTPAGTTAYRYAEEIFGVSRNLVQAIAHHREGYAGRLTVGISDVVPKLIALRVLRPVLRLQPVVTLVCKQDRPDHLVAAMGIGELDLVLSDAPMRSGSQVRGFNHLLSETGMTCFCAPEHADAYREGFPGSLDGAPMLLPSPGTMLRATIEQWLDTHDLMPLVVAEFDDNAQMKLFGQAGAGAFFAPTSIEAEIAQDYCVTPVARVPDIRERIYAVWSERSAEHAGVRAILESAPDAPGASGSAA